MWIMPLLLVFVCLPAIVLARVGYLLVRFFWVLIVAALVLSMIVSIVHH